MCGKPLWKSLWKMLKSLNFPQRKPGFPHKANFLCLHKSLNNQIQILTFFTLRNRNLMGNQSPKNHEKVQKPGEYPTVQKDEADFC